VTDPRQPIIVLTTLGSAEAARELVRTLVDERIVACGTVLPAATSIYRWQGAVTTEAEAVVLLKTVFARWDHLVRAIERLHPYEAPELLALPPAAGLPRYVEWLAAETTEVAA
jgi:periplasmic divalent cation tolerance protein